VQWAPRDIGLPSGPEGKALEPSSAVDYTLGHAHDGAVGSLSLRESGDLDESRLTSLLHEQSASLYRPKGIVSFAGKEDRHVVHGVHTLLVTEDRPWSAGEPRESQWVLIGRDLDRSALRRGFRACVATARARKA
jgi:G3E family GTPase